jgi:uncharacterized protein YndB with AHSA1/START domain
MSKDDRVEKTIEMRAPRSRVWRAISNGKDFGAWFGLGSPLELVGDFVPGAQITGKWTVDGKAVNEHFCTITKVEPETYLAFDWIPYELSPGEDTAKHPRTHVEFRLEDTPTGTRLTVSESGFAKLPADKQYKRADNAQGWALQVHAIAQHVLGRVEVSVETTQLQLAIEKPLAEVREAIVDPARMARYFISKSSGRMESGANLVWEWSDIGAKSDIKVRKVEDTKIVFMWGLTDNPTQVEITLAPHEGGTKLHIVEHPFELSEDSAKRAVGQAQGWAHFCCCLVAYLEHGIDLRRGRRVT